MMRTKLKDKNALAQCETSIRESQKRVEFLENELKKLSMKKSRAGTAPMHSMGSPSEQNRYFGMGYSMSHNMYADGSGRCECECVKIEY
jgi:hypothetical protein